MNRLNSSILIGSTSFCVLLPIPLSTGVLTVSGVGFSTTGTGFCSSATGVSTVASGVGFSTTGVSESVVTTFSSFTTVFFSESSVILSIVTPSGFTLESTGSPVI